MASKKTLPLKTRRFRAQVGLAMRGVIRAKLNATGVNYSRLHRIESMLATCMGVKAPRKDKKKKKKTKATKK